MSAKKSWVLLILLSCIWGSSFILMKKGMFAENGETIFSANQLGALRMLIASLIMLPLGITRLKLIKKKHVFALLIVGFCGNIFPAFLFPYAETEVSSGFAGMLNSFTPIFTLIICFSIFKTKVTKQQIIGLIIGSIGAITLSLSGNQGNENYSLIHISAIIIATFFYALNLSYIKFRLNDLNPIDIAALGFIFVFPFALGASIYFKTDKTILTNDYATQGLIYISILAVIGTSLALIIFNKIISLTSPLFASSVTYFIPIVAMIIGIVFNEKIEAIQILAMFVILAGVFIINRKKNQNDY